MHNRGSIVGNIPPSIGRFARRSRYQREYRPVVPTSGAIRTNAGGFGARELFRTDRGTLTSREFCTVKEAQLTMLDYRERRVTGEIQSTYYKRAVVRVAGNCLLLFPRFISHGRKLRFYLQREAAGERVRVR